MAVRTQGRRRSERLPRDLDPAVPVMALGLGSNMIVRDGGVAGRGRPARQGLRHRRAHRRHHAVVRRRGKSGILVSSSARDAGIAGMEFLRSIPGTVGGFVRMNGGAYGREVKDILIDCEVVLRSGERRTLRSPNSAIPIATANCPKAPSSWARPSAAIRRARSDPGRDGPHRGGARSLAAAALAAPAVRPSRIPRGTRPGR
jgi:hypothetical protein